MFDWLLNWYIDSRIRRQRASIPAIQWRELVETIRADIAEYPVFLEMRDNHFEPLPQGSSTVKDVDVVGVVVACAREGVPPWETKTPATELADRLSNRGFETIVQLSRDPNSFVGYYVRLRPHTISASGHA